ncbi:hypothetical protein [Actinomadura coerulea]|uniref:hypothetical protein n=1 Tax=Actinomadura coerulea TaxID=46159 RepID=UPI00341F95D3
MSDAIPAAYAALSLDQRRFCQLLALMPGTACDHVFSPAAAAAALQVDEETADAILDLLCTARLLDRHGDFGQWQMPVPVRTHVRALAEGMADDDRDASLARVVRHYLIWAAELDTLIAPGRRRQAPVFGELPEHPPAASSCREALALLRAWAPTLAAAQAAAAHRGMHHLAWQFTDVMWGYLTRQQDYPIWRQICEVALESVQYFQDPGAHARVHALAGLLDQRCGNLGSAEDHHIQSGRRARQADDTLAQAAAAQRHGATLLDQNKLDEALQVLHGALALYRAAALPHRRGEALLHRHLGTALARLRQPADAEKHFTDAEAILAECDEPYLLACLAVDQARAALVCGQPRRALEYLDQALRLFPEASVPDEAFRLYLSYRAYTGTGEHDAADRALSATAALAERLPPGHPTALLIQKPAQTSSEPSNRPCVPSAERRS